MRRGASSAENVACQSFNWASGFDDGADLFNQWTTAGQLEFMDVRLRIADGIPQAFQLVPRPHTRLFGGAGLIRRSWPNV